MVCLILRDFPSMALTNVHVPCHGDSNASTLFSNAGFKGSTLLTKSVELVLWYTVRLRLDIAIFLKSTTLLNGATGVSGLLADAGGIMADSMALIVDAMSDLAEPGRGMSNPALAKRP